jgi:hypothetical protein
MEDKIFNPDIYDRAAFILFNKALHYMFQVNEGIVIEEKGQKVVVGKWIKDNEEVVGIHLPDEFGNELNDLNDGQFVWLHLGEEEENK